MLKVHYRRATLDDLEACLFFEWTRPLGDLEAHINADLIFVAAEWDDVVGYARLESFWKTMPYLALIVVQEDRRGAGVGSALLGFLKGELKAKGYTHLLSSATATEPEPQRWHRRNGFVDIGTLAGLNADGQDEVFFRLTL